MIPILTKKHVEKERKKARMIFLPKCEPIILTKKQLEEERKRSKNLCWPYSPAIYEILPKKKAKNKPLTRRAV